jgi:hypothetical protein
MPAVPSSHLAVVARIVQALALCILAAGAAPAMAQQPFVTTKGDLKREAWWLIADFHPFTTEVRGIPVARIRSSWCKATEFRKELIPKALLIDNGVDAMATYKMSFAVEGRFDGSATKQVALVGVYQECAGRKGRFLLILDLPQGGGPPKVRFVDAQRTAHPFGALSISKDNGIVQWECMECDIYSVLKWNARQRRFAWVPGKGGD